VWGEGGGGNNALPLKASALVFSSFGVPFSVEIPVMLTYEN